VDVGVQVLYTELLIGVLVLFHENTVLNFLVSARLLEVPWENYSAHEQNEVLECHEEEQEDNEWCWVGATEEGLHTEQPIIFQHCDHAQEEENVVAEGEDEYDVAHASCSENIDHR